MTPTDPSTWLPGQVVLHRDGSVGMVDWCAPWGWELTNKVIIFHATKGDWIALTPAHVAHLFNLAGAG